MDINFGWSPVLFLILLAVSLVLAARVWKDWKIAWLLPAMVLWFGLDWVLPSPWSDLAPWAFWLAVAAVIITAVLPGEAQFTWVPLAVISAIIILGLLGSGWDWANNDDDNVTATTPTTKSPSATKAPAVDDEFVINMPKRTGDRLNADGVPDDIRGDGEKVRTFIAEQAKRDPLTLFNYYMSSPLGDSDPLKNETVLAKDGNVKDGNVFSKKGVETYNRWVAIWNNPDITSIKAVKEITFQGTNTGVTDDNKPTQDPSGVRGKDKSGYDVTYKDATGKVVKEHSVLNRCTQTTTKTPHKGIPKGPTDNPPPPSDTPPPTTEVCPPNMPHGKPPFCKDGPEKQRNTGDGPGKNADPGPGTYVAPKDMEKPGKTPRTNPPAPKPTPGKGNGGGSTPKPEPTFSHPAPEPSAPKPDNPETGCVPIPGVEDC